MSASRKLLQSTGSFHGRKFLESMSALPAINGKEDGLQVPDISETAFNSNLAIVLVALFCAVLCAPGLILMGRRILCCNRRMVSESAEDVGIQQCDAALKKKAMGALSATVYSAHGSRFAEAGDDCPICLAEFFEGENVRVLPKCNHCFHVECIDTWLLAHSSCPTCRRCLVDIICDTKSGVGLSCDTPSPVQPSATDGSQTVPSNHVVESRERPFAVADDTSPLPSSDFIASADLEGGENAWQSYLQPCN